jgi:hypothetical protein
MGLASLFGIKENAGSGAMQQALAALQSVNVPSIAQLTLPELQKYVSAGVLTPEQYQAISADPNTFQQIAGEADMSGQAAQKAALQQLGGVVNAGGSTAINQANLQNNINQTNQAMQAARQGIEQQAQERGVAGGGQEFLSKLLNEQGNAQTANTGAVNAAANNAQLALQAMTQQGQLGGQMQSQSSADALAKAQAAQQIGEYNSQLQSAANQYNTQAANAAQAANLQNAQNIGNQNTQDINQRTMYNAQLPQTQFNNAMQKANAVAGQYNNQSNLEQKQAQQQAGFTGNLLGTGATLAGAYYGSPSGASAGKTATDNMQGSSAYGADPNAYGYDQNNQRLLKAHGGEIPGYNEGGMCYAEGGEVHDHEICMKVGGQVPGDDSGVPPMQDDEANDTVPAKLSPHEIVLPRSVAQAPNAPEAASQFVAETKGLQPTAGSFADVLNMLEANGLELRLTSGGH